MSPEGQPIRQNTAIDIPLQIALPHFIQDDKTSDDGPLFGNFNLVLQSVVCHRGTSLHTGHYISLIRGTAKTRAEVPNTTRRNSADSELPAYSEDQWIKFDDLAPERVVYVDIEKAMAVEMPYLLFYQVQPIYPDEPSTDLSNRPPSYQDSAIGMTVQEATPVNTTMPDMFPQSSTGSSYFDGQTSSSEEPSKARISISDDVERSRKSLNIPDSSRRESLAFTDASTTSSIPSIPVTPNEEAPSSRLSRAASRFGRRNANGEKSKSRPPSHVDENRISATFSKLGLMAGRGSKEALNRNQESPTSDVPIPVKPSADGFVTAGEKSGWEVDEQAPLQPRIEPTLPPHSDSKRSKKGKGKHENKSPEASNSYHHHHDQDHSHKGIGAAHMQGAERVCVLM